MIEQDWQTEGYLAADGPDTVSDVERSESICAANFRCGAGARANRFLERKGSRFRYSIHLSMSKPDHRVSL